MRRRTGTGGHAPRRRRPSPPGSRGLALRQARCCIGGATAPSGGTCAAGGRTRDRRAPRADEARRGGPEYAEVLADACGAVGADLPRAADGTPPVLTLETAVLKARLEGHQGDWTVEDEDDPPGPTAAEAGRPVSSDDPAEAGTLPGFAAPRRQAARS